MFDNTRPIFIQLADRLADDILRGTYAEGGQVPSTNELAAHLRINPATAGKGLNLLVDQQILTKRRGVGMFVAEGAKRLIAIERQRKFVEMFVVPMVQEASVLGLDRSDLDQLLNQEFKAFTKSEGSSGAPPG